MKYKESVDLLMSDYIIPTFRLGTALFIMLMGSCGVLVILASIYLELKGK